MSKKFLVIGGAGTIGSAFVRGALAADPSCSMSIFSRSEASRHAFLSENPELIKDVGFFIGDIKDIAAVRKCLRVLNPTHIVVTAAMKRIEVCEENPVEALQVNALGIDNVCRAALECPSVEAVLYTSTDKASDPIGVYGNTKALAEAIVRNYAREFPFKRFLITRFANVLNSTGSVIPIFRKRISQGLPLQVRGDMTRFFITETTAAKTIWDALFGKDLFLYENGNVLIPFCNSMKIADLANIMVEHSGKDIPVVYTEPLPFEKMDELLISADGERHYKGHNHTYAILDLENVSNYKTGRSFISSDPETLLTKEKLYSYLKSCGILT